MNEELHDNMRGSLSFYAEDMSPRYQEARSAIDVSGSEADIALDSIREVSEQVKNNLVLLSKFRSILPNANTYIDSEPGRYDQTYHFGYYFNTKDISEARFLQNSTLWTPWTLNDRPNYIIGEKYDGHHVDVLLLPAKDMGPAEASKFISDKNDLGNMITDYNRATTSQPYLATLKKKSYQAFKERTVYTGYSQEELASLYNAGSDSLHVSGHSPQSASLNSMMTRRWPYVKELKQNELTNQMMISFDVPDHLNSLATAFDRVAEYDSLLQ